MYLSLIWIAGLYFRDSFKIKEEWWRSGILCLTTFASILYFTLLTENLLIILSLSTLMVVLYPLKSRFKETSYIVKILVILILFSLFFTIIIVLIFKSTNTAVTISICLPFLDPTGSQITVKLIIWLCVITQIITSIVIMVMHCLLLNKLRQSQKNIRKSNTDNNIPLAIQLIMITVSNILCWLPTGCVYISAIFLANYPVDMIIWTTVIGVPINSVINPFIFITTTVRKIIKFEI